MAYDAYRYGYTIDGFSNPSRAVSDGKKLPLGRLELMLVHDDAFGESDSIPARLARLCHGDDWRRSRIERKTGRNRAEALKRPINCAVAATLLHVAGQRRTGTGISPCLQLAGAEAVQHDLGLLLDSTNLLGGVCQQVDVKRWM